MIPKPVLVILSVMVLGFAGLAIAALVSGA